MLELARPLLEAAVAGSVRAWIDRVLRLEEAAHAHALLEGRRTMGKLLLEP
jgi:NADPH:quinone reductase-like Zn-dependent oxidoreductase